MSSLIPDLRLGDYRTVLDGESWDALICDPPYSDRTHSGFDSRQRKDGYRREPIIYEPFTREHVRDLVDWAVPRTRGWLVCITDDVLIQHYRQAFEDRGLYAFAPVPWVDPAAGPRLGGDGPASWTCYIMAARPRDGAFVKWGSLPGAYVLPRDPNPIVIGSKPLRLMEALVRDYSRPGDVVCDPFSGGATTLLAAFRRGRASIGAELSPDTHRGALERLQTECTQPRKEEKRRRRK